MSLEIGLVSCVKTKQNESAVPKNLYISDYFSKMRTFAEDHHDDWYILSAKHGLLDPDGPEIEPYDDTLRNASVGEKRAWAQNVYQQMRDDGFFTLETTLVIHAGKDYYSEFLPYLEDDEVEVKIPTEGMGIGERKAWYKARN
ncbi:putative glycoside hydrolase family 15 protein [Halocatena marina]|uniref:Glycoside hydrolase family 15 protein n=1 Tax=Halocatena marina TaxID=2934937 RepID=A0ABD5YW20_9EURY|nr:putative glycoside hydrolase family 15 protein [Halocatena marina]